MRVKLLNLIPTQFKQNRLLKNIFVLASGTFIANLLTFLVSPILSRVYSPTEFGLLGSIISVSSVVVVVGSFKYELAIIIEKDREKAIELKKLCLFLLLINSTLLLVGVLVFPKLINPEIENKYYFALTAASFFVLIEGLIQVQSYWFNKEGMYGTISKSRVIHRIGTLATQLSFFKLNSWGLILGRIIGGISALVYFNLKLPIIVRRWRSVSVKNMFALAKKHKKFALFSSPQNLLNSLSQNSPIYFLTFYFGFEVVGWYWFSKRLLQMPLGILSNAISQVLYKEIAESSNISHTRKLHLKATVTLLKIIIIPIVLVFLFSPFLFPYIFGQNWTEAGVFARWIIIYSGLGIIISPSVAVINSYGMQKYYLFYESFWLSIRVMSLFISCQFYDFEIAVILDSIIGSVYCILLPLLVYLKIRNRE